MKRDLYQNLAEWKVKKNRKPLILQGARQVGKTHLLTLFSKNEFKNTLYLNFESQPELASYFEGKIDPKRIIENLSILFSTEINSQETCLIFDEIQECPKALSSLKYFCESAPEYALLTAGSLLGVKLSQTGFPVGKVDFLTLHPMSFLEYLTAIDKHSWRVFLEQISNQKEIPDPLHEELLRAFQFYLFVGGMPEAVAKYCDTHNLEQTREVQNAIIRSYQLDFSKHAPANQAIRINEVWDSIPAQLAKENKKFIFSAIRKSARGRDYDVAIEWLRQAGLVSKVKRISTPKIPLSAYADNDVYKLYLVDVGLLGALSKLPAQLTVQANALFSEFKGALIENYVMQETLIDQSEDLFYWTSSGMAEVDLVTSTGVDVYPVEIKSGLSKHKKSLLVYQTKYLPKKIIRTNPRNLTEDGALLNIPLYMIRQGLKNLIG